MMAVIKADRNKIGHRVAFNLGILPRKLWQDLQA
jgi:hypothetical protein